MAGFGLRLARSQGMEGFTGNLFEFTIDAANANAIFTGDPVVLNGGNVEVAAAGANPILGVFMGCRYVDNDGDYDFKRFWDGATGRSDIKAHVAMPPHSMFWIKGDAGVDFQPATSVGAAHPLVLAAGSTQYGDSRAALGAPGAGPLIVHRIVELPNNVWGTDEPILEVSVNLHQGTFADAS